jgi:hypothetical protein
VVEVEVLLRLTPTDPPETHWKAAVVEVVADIQPDRVLLPELGRILLLTFTPIMPLVLREQTQRRLRRDMAVVTQRVEYMC